jgi:hypothetical protein
MICSKNKSFNIKKLHVFSWLLVAALAASLPISAQAAGCRGMGGGLRFSGGPSFAFQDGRFSNRFFVRNRFFTRGRFVPGSGFVGFGFLFPFRYPYPYYWPGPLLGLVTYACKLNAFKGGSRGENDPLESVRAGAVNEKWSLELWGATTASSESDFPLKATLKVPLLTSHRRTLCGVITGRQYH